MTVLYDYKSEKRKSQNRFRSLMQLSFRFHLRLHCNLVGRPIVHRDEGRLSGIEMSLISTKFNLKPIEPIQPIAYSVR